MAIHCTIIGGPIHCVVSVIYWVSAHVLKTGGKKELYLRTCEVCLCAHWSLYITETIQLGLLWYHGNFFANSKEKLN